MPLNNKNRPIRRKSIRNIKSPRDNNNHNQSTEESRTTKSPVKDTKSKTTNKQEERKTKRAFNNNFVGKTLRRKDQICLETEIIKNKSTQSSASKNKNASPAVFQKSSMAKTRKNSKSTKADSTSNNKTRDTPLRKRQSSKASQISKKEKQAKTKTPLINNSLVKNIKSILKEKKLEQKLSEHPASESNVTSTESSPIPKESNIKTVIQKRPVVILKDDIKANQSKTTHLASTNETKAAHSPERNQSQESIIKPCCVLLTPLPQRNLKQKHVVKKTEVINNLKAPIKMKNALKSRTILRGSPREASNGPLQKVDGVTTNTASIDEMKNKPQNSNQKNIQDKLIKKPLVDRTNLNKATPVQKLRKRKLMNYAESSLEVSRDLQKNVNTNKIPVYQQQTNKMKLKEQEDTYEFDSDSEQRKKRKKRRLNNSSSSDEYNKIVENILKNVATKIKRKKNNVFPKYKNNNNCKNSKPMKLSTVPIKKENIVQNKPIINVTSELKNNEVEKNITFEMAVKAHQPEELSVENVENQDYSDGDDNDDLFGFDHLDDNKENSPTIQIISDIRFLPNKELNLSVGGQSKYREELQNENKGLNFSVETPTKFKNVRPNAHSTMLNNVLTPWRFNDINIMRNPHFITLKESSLPCINQEMVLDHTMVDKFADTSKTESAKTPHRISDENVQNHKMLQSIVTDFFESNTENKENENTQPSLFDSDQFSPIKSRKKQFNKVDSVKRRILGELNDNKKVFASTPKQNATNLRIPELEITNKNSAKSDSSSNLKDSQKKRKCNEEFTNFGFTSSDEENDNQVSPKRDRDNKPFRLNVNVNDRKYPVKQKPNKTKKAESVVLSDSESEMSELSDAESHNGEVKLFEGYDSTPNSDRFLESKIFKKKNKTRRHKNRKDVRTREEEEEAEKWAAAFNSMCKEIEEFPLEIE